MNLPGHARPAGMAGQPILLPTQPYPAGNAFGGCESPKLLAGFRVYIVSCPVDTQQERPYSPVVNLKERSMAAARGEVLQGTLDLIVLKTLDSMGPLHGYGISQRIQQVSEDLLKLNQGTLYPALLRLEQRGWISSKWGVSDNNRKAKYYSLTRSGRKQLADETESWERMAAVIARLLSAEGA